MAKVKFTDEQREAIDTLDKSILVSAAAGSGKTAVLIQRIINIILQGEAEVDEMLVVTFTNAAAAEMRVKLSREIKKRMQEEGADKAKLSAQLEKLYRAYISTFNSFAIRVIREFFYAVDIEPSFKVCDEITGTMLQIQAVDELFEEAFENDELIEGGSFREFLRLYSSDRSEKKIKEDIMAAYGKLRSMPDYFDWAHDKAKLLSVDIDDLRGSELENQIRDSFELMLKDVLKDMRIVRDLYYDEGLGELYDEKLLSELTMMEEVAERGKSVELGDDLLELIDSVEFARLSRVKAEYKDSYDSIKDDVKKLRDRYKKTYNGWAGKFLSPSLEQRLFEMKESYRYTEYFLNLLYEFEQRFSALKRDQGMMDFSDMEHTAARILKNDDIADTLRKRFKFIFIDEYQDTNNIQESLIERISRPDNVFKVGDVKQSIYRFRQAEPSIFEKTYKDYKSDERAGATSIDLNKNFRCNSRTVAYINKVFEDCMDGYDEAAKLNVGVECPDEYDFIPELHLLVKAGASDDDDEMLEDVADGEIRELSKDEAEAEYVVGIVNKLIGTEFYDTVTKTVRKVQAKDIAILLRSTKFRGELYTKAFRNHEIQSHIEEEADYFDSVEIKVALSILMTIDNFKRDVPLIATLHSEVFAFSTEDLGRIRAEHKQYLREKTDSARRGVPFWQAVKWYAEAGSDAALRQKILDTVSQLESWRELATMMPLSDFIWKVLTESNYYMYAGAMYGGSRRQANLRTLADKASQFSSNKIASLGDYIAYLEIMRSKKIKNGQASMVSKDDDVVRITTIHKSKGLEYPFVIIAGMGNKPNTDHNEKGFMFDTNIGVGLPYVSPDKTYWRSTIVQRAILEKSLKDGEDEELRVLYVAMTRARNKLILVGTIKEGEEEKLRNGVYNAKTYLGSIGRNIETPFNRRFITTLETKGRWDVRSSAKDVIDSCSKDIPESMKSEYDDTYREISRRLDYKYPEDRLKFKAKYSVSEIRKEAIAELDMSENGTADEEVVSIVRHSNTQKKRASSTDIGIAYHRIMEYVDFGKVMLDSADGTRTVDKSYIKRCADELAERGAIDADAYKDVELEHIFRFFDSTLGRRAVAANANGTLKREKPFTLVHERKGQSVLVQGVIDCCFEEDGEMVLIDYKSSFVRKGLGYSRDIAKIKRDYMPQIEIYSEALKVGTGKPVKDAYLYLFLSDEAVRMEEDESESARQKLGRLCKRIGMSDLEGFELSGDEAESRRLIDALNESIAEVLQSDKTEVLQEDKADENEEDKAADNLGPAPDNKIWCELSDLVKRAFPKGFKKSDDKELAKQVHQLRYVISAQQVEYVRKRFKAKRDEESLAKYFSTLGGRWSDEESDRLHNKMTVDTKSSLGGRFPNIKLVCGDFHSEFILDSDGNFVYLLNPKATMNDIVNCSSFNYADGNDLWLDGEENPLSIHGLLDVKISSLDPEFRRSVTKGYASPSLIEYRLKGGRAASVLRKKAFVKKIKK